MTGKKQRLKPLQPTKKRWPKLVFVFACLCLISCGRKKITNRSEALRPAPSGIEFTDDLPVAPLLEGIKQHIALMEKPNYPYPLVFANKRLDPKDYAQGLKAFVATAEKVENLENLRPWIKQWFNLYEVYGRKDWGRVFITSYFEPVIKGSRQKTDRHSSALYRRPRDLVHVAIDKFDDRFKDIRRMMGRLVKEGSGRMRLVPYYDRKEIEQSPPFKPSLAMAWVDPIDGFFLQIQGSGTVQFEDGKELRVGYDGQNGHVYKAIGKFVTDVIPLKELTALNLEAHLRTLDTSDRDEIFFENPSYVFFRKLKGEPVTAIQTEVVAGRTIATDAKYLPKGGLCYLRFKKPRFLGPILSAPAYFEETGRFVLDQDTGGAIRGAGRVDLFWGRGHEAKQHASVMKSMGELYYLAPKPELLEYLVKAKPEP